MAAAEAVGETTGLDGIDISWEFNEVGSSPPKEVDPMFGLDESVAESPIRSVVTASTECTLAPGSEGPNLVGAIFAERSASQSPQELKQTMYNGQVIETTDDTPISILPDKAAEGASTGESSTAKESSTDDFEFDAPVTSNMTTNMKEDKEEFDFDSPPKPPDGQPDLQPESLTNHLDLAPSQDVMTLQNIPAKTPDIIQCTFSAGQIQQSQDSQNQVPPEAAIASEDGSVDVQRSANLDDIEFDFSATSDNQSPFIDLGSITDSDHKDEEQTPSSAHVSMTTDIQGHHSSSVVTTIAQRQEEFPMEVTGDRENKAQREDKDQIEDNFGESGDVGQREGSSKIEDREESEEEDLEPNSVMMGLKVETNKNQDDDFDFEFTSPQKPVSQVKEESNMTSAAPKFDPVLPHAHPTPKTDVLIVQQSVSRHVVQPTIVPPKQVSEAAVDVDEDSSEEEEAGDRAAAEAAWSRVATVTPTVCEHEDQILPATARRAATEPLVSYYEFLDHCQQGPWQQHRGQIKTSIERRGFSCIKQVLFGPPRLNAGLHNERDMVFCLAASPLNNDDTLHSKVLQTIYRKLTGSKFECHRFGSHWEEIGFQGNDPATDLRSAGILGLLQLLYLVADGRTAALARDIYKLSTHETQNFPFCIMGINMTRIALQTMREGLLNKECNRCSAVVVPFNDFYAATYYHLYSIWKSQHKTIADTGYVLKDVETFAKKNPKQLIQNLTSQLAKRKQGSSATSGNDMDFEGGGGIANFVDVCAEE